MIEINKNFLSDLLAEAAKNPRLRQSYDLRTTPEDNSQRMLNALLPGTKIPIHRHPNSSENVFLLQGRIIEVLYEEDKLGDGIERGMDAQDVTVGHRLRETARIVMDPSSGSFGCIVPVGTWHTVEVLKSSVIHEAKDGRYGKDGSEVW